MRKAKVVAIVCGILASCLIGGFAVVDAATITLDDSSTTEPVKEMTAAEEEATEAATETSLETTAPVRESIAVQTETLVTETMETETAAETETAEEETVAETEPASTEEAAAEETDETEKAEDETAVVETLDLSTVTASDEVYIQNGNVITDPVSLNQPAVKESVVETIAEDEEEKVSDNSWVYSVSQRDYILLCNAVGHEAGANEISVEEKAKVVEVIMNRVYSDVYPDDVYSVLTQQNQFTGASTYVDLGTFSPKVSDMVKEAVDLYFADPSQFNHGYIGFWGDGHQNHFKTY